MNDVPRYVQSSSPHNLRPVIGILCDGINLSKEALELYDARCVLNNLPSLSCANIPRNDPLLVEIVEELGAKANGICSKLFIADIPDEYASCYDIRGYGDEMLVCNPDRLVRHLLLKIDINTVTDQECRLALINCIEVLKTKNLPN